MNIYTFSRPVEQVAPGDYVVRRSDTMCAEVAKALAGELIYIDGVRETYAADEFVPVAARTIDGALVGRDD